MLINRSLIQLIRLGVLPIFILSGVQVNAAAQPTSQQASAERKVIKAQIWVDNWFALYAGDTLIKEDSVPYNTERSFNTESFAFSTALPAQLSVVMKDFKEDDTGLEYIGSSHQQAGDGGFIAQFTDAATNKTLAVSDDGWRCTVIHKAPVNLQECENSNSPRQVCKSKIDPEPANWKSAGYDYRNWPNATIHSAWEVQPHGDFNWFDWKMSAKFIWSPDLVRDNTVLCRFTIPAP